MDRRIKKYERKNVSCIWTCALDIYKEVDLVDEHAREFFFQFP